jgi:hypothetical protein
MKYCIVGLTSRGRSGSASSLKGNNIREGLFGTAMADADEGEVEDDLKVSSQ